MDGRRPELVYQNILDLVSASDGRGRGGTCEQHNTSFDRSMFGQAGQKPAIVVVK